MIFKHEELKDQFFQVDPRLRLLACEAEVFLRNRGKEAIVTSVIRNPEEQEALFLSGQSQYKTSVHCVGRGLDLRYMEEPISSELANYLNQKYVYDSHRPTLKSCLVHSGTAMHIHLQVCDKNISGNGK